MKKLFPIFLLVLILPPLIFFLNVFAMIVFGKARMAGVPYAKEACEFSEQTLGLPLNLIMTSEKRGNPYGKTCWGP